jgi:uncharacterized protein (UPF0335 family)
MSNIDAALKSIIDRIEATEKQIDEYTQDRKDIYAEAKSNGYDVDALKDLVKERKQDSAKRDKAKRRQESLELYKMRLGMLADTPLGKAALDQVS